VSLRYYLYISDAKVDMLLQQIDPGFARRRSAEVGVNLTVVSAKRTVESIAPDRVTRLERVVRQLDDHYDVGTIDEPGQYFRGRLPMRWGPLATGQGVYFGGSTEQTIVGLGGATGHVVGAVAPAEAPPVFAPSTMPGVLDGLAATIADDDSVPDSALASVYLASRQLAGAEQDVEFLAKRLLYEPSPFPELDARDGMTVLLGSPLFVALAD
jgi:hypothetical protein